MTEKDRSKLLASNNPEDWIDIRWHVLDVMDKADEMEIEITLEEAREVLYIADRKHDCNIGITWEVLEFWIGEIIH